MNSLISSLNFVTGKLERDLIFSALILFFLIVICLVYDLIKLFHNFIISYVLNVFAKSFSIQRDQVSVRNRHIFY